MEWTREYGTRAHQTQRSGPIPGSMPSLEECDEMIREQEKTLQAMARIREVIFKQHQALQEQKIYDQRNYKATPSEADDDHNSYMDKLDGQGGFAGSDAKKRRGRAAPPGRCHSCSRAETPEWRRGPDGARTLCNACGLREFMIAHGHDLCLTDYFNRLRETDEEDGVKGAKWPIEPTAKGIEPVIAVTIPASS